MEQRDMALWAKRSACCCCACFWVTLAILALALVININPVLQGVEDGSIQPGDAARRGIQPHLASALLNGDFSQVEALYTAKNTAMLIGDASGVRWEKSNGFIDLDEPYSVASQTKVITALTIYRVMAKPGANLSLSSKPSEFFPLWPTAGFAGEVTMAHLLAFVSGIHGNHDLDHPGCARPPMSENTADDHWELCIDEIGNYEGHVEPGILMHYGPWHLMVAAGMAVKAIGRPLSADSWISLVQEEVFGPAGISVMPRYEPVQFFSTTAFGLQSAGKQFPDFSGGMVMTARQLGKVMQAVQFGQLLPDVWLQRFLSDEYGSNVTSMESVGPLSTGTWRYGQGHWIACDAAAEKYGSQNPWPVEEANTLCEVGRSPEIHHSVGAFGAYAWMDFTTNCYGVLMHHWDRKLLSGMHLAFGLAPLFGVIVGIGCTMVCCWAMPCFNKPQA